MRKGLSFNEAVLLWLGFFCASACLSNLFQGNVALFRSFGLTALLMVVFYIMGRVAAVRYSRRSSCFVFEEACE